MVYVSISGILGDRGVLLRNIRWNQFLFKIGHCPLNSKLVPITYLCLVGQSEHVVLGGVHLVQNVQRLHYHLLVLVVGQILVTDKELCCQRVAMSIASLSW